MCINESGGRQRDELSFWGRKLLITKALDLERCEYPGSADYRPETRLALGSKPAVTSAQVQEGSQQDSC